ncbi:MAG TPA: glycosyltransferase family 39 protein [Candidatus Acidoferrum sp.]|nr:glycosyltransferase family 39 protein [Candidatus Acidoferrum sp.]
MEDEVAIVDAATAPVATTLQLFWTGEGQHDHPPLSDILLHYWLDFSGSSIWLLRLPSILFYVAGIALLRLCARQLGGNAAANNLLWLALLWPYGFHYGRLAGWYAFSFFLVSGLTLAYLRLLESPKKNNWLWLFGAALALVYTNYYGWAMLGCLLIDFIARQHRKGIVGIYRVAVVAAILVLAYLPLWPLLLDEISRTNTGFNPAEIVYGGFNLYDLFVSGSVAPWYWPVGIPAAAAIAIVLVLVLIKGSSDARAYLLYFAALFAVMVATGIVLPKRLLLISPWLLLPVSLTLAQADRKPARILIASLLIVTGGAGWVGVFTRDHYSTPNLIEPWEAVAADAKQSLAEGAVVLSNHPVFFFYLTRALACADSETCTAFTGVLPITVRHPRVFDVTQWPPAASEAGRVIFVRGVNGNLLEAITSAQRWLDDNCQLTHRDSVMSDSGYEWKHRMFPSHGSLPYRIEVSQYSCRASSIASP